jgi:DNA-binding beta-propeller fold protein YncE
LPTPEITGSRVQIFDSDANFITDIKLPKKNKHAPDPTDVVVDEIRNRCYIVDNDNHSILVYDLSTLKLIETYGTPGAGKGQFRYPFLITMDPQNYLYIVDVINTRVQILNKDGLFVNFIGSWGVEKGELYRPKGVALDKNNRIYVSDSWMGVIQVFEPTGDFYAALGDGLKRSVKRFKTPVGLFIDTRNRMYVVEMFANKVSVYRLGEAFISE